MFLLGCNWNGYPLVTGVAISGGEIDDFLRVLQAADRNCDIIVHWALNGQYKKRSKGPKVLQDLDAEFFIKVRKMTDMIKEFNRSLVICGGNAACWDLDPRFDAGANKVREVLRGYGYPDLRRHPVLHGHEAVPGPGWMALPEPQPLPWKCGSSSMSLRSRPCTSQGGRGPDWEGQPIPKDPSQGWTRLLVQVLVVPLAPRPKQHDKGEKRRKDSPP